MFTDKISLAKLSVSCEFLKFLGYFCQRKFSLCCIFEPENLFPDSFKIKKFKRTLKFSAENLIFLINLLQIGFQ